MSSFSSKDTDEERIMHSKSDNIEPMIRDKVDEVIKEIGLNTSIKGGDFVCDSVCFFLLVVCCIVGDQK